MYSGMREQMAHGGAIGGGDQLHGVGGQAGLGGRFGQEPAMAALEWAASLPPRRITALPLLTQARRRRP